MKLFHFPRAPHARKVNIFVLEKGIDLPRVEVNLATRENLEPAFLAKTGRGVVPVLELDDGSCIDESLAICRYLENRFPEPCLFGRDAKEKAVIDSWERHMEFDGYQPGADAFRNSVDRFANYAVAGVTEEFKAIPELAERGRRRLDIFFRRLDARLADTEFVGGERFSMADITAVVAVDSAKRSQKFLPADCLHAQRWYEAMYGRDSVSSTHIDA